MGICEAKAAISPPPPPAEDQNLARSDLPPPPTTAVESLAADLGATTLEPNPDEMGTPGEGTGTRWKDDDGDDVVVYEVVKPVGWEDEEQPVAAVKEERIERDKYPQGPGEPDCSFDLKPMGWDVTPTGWGDDDDDDDVVVYEVVKPVGWEEEEEERPVAAAKEGRVERVKYPRRPGEPDCSFYLKNGSCKFGVNCRFNHPLARRKKNKGKAGISAEPVKMGSGKVQMVSNTEDLGLGLPSSFHCPVASVAEAFSPQAKNVSREKLEVKSDVDDNRKHPKSDGHVNPNQDSMSTKEGENKTFCSLHRPHKLDCSYYLKTGTCQYGSNCKFNHPPRRKGNKVKTNKQSEPIQEKKNFPRRVEKAENKKVVKEKQSVALPQKMEQRISKKNDEKTPLEMARNTESKAIEEKETPSDRDGWEEFKHSAPEGNKIGETSKYTHFPEKAELDPVELNFLGLPKRPGETECPYYMRTGGCKFAASCRYNHPDPIAMAGHDTVPGYQDDASAQQHASALPMMSWPLPMASNESLSFFQAPPPYTPGFYPLPPQGFYPNPHWNGYQVPMTPWVPPEINAGNCPASGMSGPDVAIHQQAQIDEYPDRPGQPECHYFMRNGSCKFKSACRYHHPKTRLQKCQ